MERYLSAERLAMTMLWLDPCAHAEMGGLLDLLRTRTPWHPGLDAGTFSAYDSDTASEQAHERDTVATSRPSRDISESMFPLLHPAGLDWTMFYGLRVRADRETDGVVESLDGVILPSPSVSRTRPRLRVALTAPTGEHRDGEVVVVEARRWRWAPAPDEIAATMNRHTRCSAGRPIYPSAEVPRSALATLSELRLRRLRPGKLVAPIATERSRPGRNEPLYAIADAERITSARPALEAGVQRRRTCTTCGQTSPTPMTEARDNKRYCEQHLEAANKRVRHAERVRDHAVSTVWSREVLRDKDTVLVAILQDNPRSPLRVRAEDVAGTTLLDGELAPDQLPDDMAVLRGDVDPDTFPSWILAESAHAMLGRRILLAETLNAASTYTDILRSLGINVGYNNSLVPRRGDSIRSRYRAWTNDEQEDLIDGCIERMFAPRRRGRGPAIPAPETVLSGMRAKLAEMASAEISPDRLAYAEKLHATLPDPFSYDAYPEHRLSRRGKSGRLLRPTAGDLLRVFGDTPPPATPPHDQNRGGQS
jgi:hypothetical protein